MRIAVVHSFYSTAQPSGENVVVDEQAAALTAAGHEVHVVARRTDDEVGGWFYPLRAGTRVATGRGASPDEELAAIGPQVVHLHNTFPNFGTRWLDTWGPRTVTTLHNYRTVCAAGTLFRDGHECHDCLSRPVVPAVRHRCYRGSRLATAPVALGAMPGGGLRRVLTQSARLLTLNKEQARVISASTGKVVDVVPNFVGTGTQRKPEERWAYVGRLAADKGILELLEVWPSDEPLDVFGEGDLGEHLRGRFGEQPNVSFAGKVSRNDLLARLGAYRGLIVPSQWSEGLPTVILEALARGVPSVVSRSLAAGRELEDAGVSVRLPNSRVLTDDLVAATVKIREQGDTMRHACVALHSRRYSATSWLASVTPIYEAVASGST